MSGAGEGNRGSGKDSEVTPKRISIPERQTPPRCFFFIGTLRAPTSPPVGRLTNALLIHRFAVPLLRWRRQRNDRRTDKPQFEDLVCRKISLTVSTCTAFCEEPKRSIPIGLIPVGILFVIFEFLPDSQFLSPAPRTGDPPRPRHSAPRG